MNCNFRHCRRRTRALRFRLGFRFFIGFRLPLDQRNRNGRDEGNGSTKAHVSWTPVMRRIDELHLELPFYGSRRMTFELNKEGRGVNRKRVRRLMRVMGIEALVPRPRH